MKLVEYFNLALYEIWHNKLRTFLTLIGIIIGIGAVIIIVSVVQGAERFLVHEVEKIAPTDIIQVYARWNPSTRRQLAQLTPEDMDVLQKEFKGPIVAIAPQYWNSPELRYKEKVQSGTLISTNAAYRVIYDLSLAQGRFINENDVEDLNQVVVLGGKIAEEIFKNEDPIGKKVHLWNSTFTVIGVLEKDKKSVLTSVSMNNGRIYLPYTVWERYNGVKNQFGLMIKVKDRRLMKPILQNISKTLDERYGLADDGRSKFQAWDTADGLEQVTIVKMVLSILLSGVAGITLLVSGIGVMNIMLVIVAERTKEIGIRKALGGTKLDILTQIVIESIILCLCGGFFGVLVGYLGSNLAYKVAQNYATEIQLVVPSWSVFLSLAFTTVIGLFFGVYPAFKAAKLDPIQSLQYE